MMPLARSSLALAQITELTRLRNRFPRPGRSSARQRPWLRRRRRNGTWAFRSRYLFPAADGVDDDLLVPVIGGRRRLRQSIFLVIEEIFVAARAGDFLARQFSWARVWRAVVEIASRRRIRRREAGWRRGSKPGALHADADNCRSADDRSAGSIAGAKECVQAQEKLWGEAARARRRLPRCDGGIDGARDLFSWGQCSSERSSQARGRPPRRACAPYKRKTQNWSLLK